ncbi:MAG: type II toxin-antitoxin system YafQ family toxin [Rhodocyclales bacterium]|nr:type II toxin-antitoxin system YafQ family toxin [Rhodocyclales bacterium]
MDHPLKGDWATYRECHVGGDFLLIYQANEQQIVFVRTGTHSDLFDA